MRYLSKFIDTKKLHYVAYGIDFLEFKKRVSFAALEDIHYLLIFLDIVGIIVLLNGLG